MSNLGRYVRDAGRALRRAGNIEIFSRHRHIVNFKGFRPEHANDAFVAPTAVLIGDVLCWDQSSVWYKAVVRADCGHTITVGFCSSVGEGSVVKTLSSSGVLETGFRPETRIGHYVTIGAGCVLKSCRIDDFVMIGDKCTILEGSLVGDHVILEPGTVVVPYQHIPPNQKWGGNPATFIADLNPDESESIKEKAENTHVVAWDHIKQYLPYGYTYVELEALEKEVAAATAANKTTVAAATVAQK